MKNLNKANDGLYHIKGGSSFEKLIGSRAQVWHGTALKTSGGLTKSNLFKNKDGRIVSKKKHFTASKEKRLLQYGYGYKKGKFVPSKKSRKIRGGEGGEVGNEEEGKDGEEDGGEDGGEDRGEDGGEKNNINMDNMKMPEKEKYQKLLSQDNNMKPSIMSKIASFFSGGKSRRIRGGGVADNAAPVPSSKGGRSRRRKIRGGIYSQSSGPVADAAGSWNSSKDGSNSGPDLNLLATNYGGKSRRRRGRKLRGGMYSQSSGPVADAAGSWNSSKDGSDQGPSLNLMATNYGGKSRRRR